MNNIHWQFSGPRKWDLPKGLRKVSLMIGNMDDRKNVKQPLFDCQCLALTSTSNNLSSSSVIYELYMCLCLLLLHNYLCPKNKQGLPTRVNLMQLRIQLFTLTRIRIRIWIWNLLLIKVMRICDHWSIDPPWLHIERPRLNCERPFWALNFDLNADANTDLAFHSKCWSGYGSSFTK